MGINFNIFKASHPFSTIVGTLTGVILSDKFLNSYLLIMKLGLIFLLAQFLTGIINDYIDYESDIHYQPLKITSRGAVSPSEINKAIKLTIVLLVGVTLILMPIDISILVFLGAIIAQSYNLKFKDTPFSAIAFIAAFGMMALIPYILANGYNFDNAPIKFIFSGLILALLAHLVNDLVDYEIDTNRTSRSLVITLGRHITIVIIMSLSLLLMLIQIDITIIILTFTQMFVVIVAIKNSSYKVREMVYYVVALISAVILILIPVS